MKWFLSNLNWHLFDNKNSYFILGIGGKQRILDIGGVPYLVPLAQKHKLYDMRDYPVLTEMDIKGEEEALVIGAGAAPWTFLGRNAEVFM